MSKLADSGEKLKCVDRQTRTLQCSFTHFEQRTLKNSASQNTMSQQQLHDSSVFRMNDITAVIKC
jgi:hypothetical protein